MGGCCGSKNSLTIKFEEKELKLTNIADDSIIRKKISEDFGIDDFDICVNQMKIKDIKPFLHQSTHVEFTVRRIEKA